MSGARLIIDFHGLAVPHSLLVQALSALAPWMEEIDDFGFLPEARPCPPTASPWSRSGWRAWPGRKSGPLPK